MPDPLAKAVVNMGVLKDLVFYGPDDRVIALKGLLEKAFSRLGIKRFRGVRPFTKTGWFKGGIPSNLDIKAWSTAVTDEDKYAEDVEFMKKLYVTIKSRLG